MKNNNMQCIIACSFLNYTTNFVLISIFTIPYNEKVTKMLFDLIAYDHAHLLSNPIYTAFAKVVFTVEVYRLSATTMQIC